MDDRRRLPLGGASGPKLSTSAAQSDHDCEVRQVSGKPGDSVSSTRVKKQKQSEVPCKVPRFQYVDYPSLHQCIKQLSVPPLEGWLASCPLGKVPAQSPDSPEEKVPKFKYVDYPSLYHCIQQLSVPPLEIWSSGLVKPNSDGIQGATLGQQSSSQALREGEKKEAEQQSKTPTAAQTVVQQLKGRHQNCKNENQINTSQKLSAPRPALSKASAKNEECLRPSVISLVRTEGQKRHVEPDGWVQRQGCLGLMPRVKRKMDLEFVCASCQQTFKDPEELRTHWCGNKDHKVVTTQAAELSDSRSEDPRPSPEAAQQKSQSLPCKDCLYPCPSGSCTNRSCHIVSALLTCDPVTDQRSSVFGSPQFRACPICHNLMMHIGMCKYVTCDKCRHMYCFVCLRSNVECAKDRKCCSVAARQRFQT